MHVLCEGTSRMTGGRERCTNEHGENSRHSRLISAIAIDCPGGANRYVSYGVSTNSKKITFVQL